MAVEVDCATVLRQHDLAALNECPQRGQRFPPLPGIEAIELLFQTLNFNIHFKPLNRRTALLHNPLSCGLYVVTMNDSRIT